MDGSERQSVPHAVEPWKRLQHCPAPYPQRLTHRQFKRYCELVYQQCGIHLTHDKKALLNARLAKRLRRLGLQADQYYRLICKNAREMTHFLDAVATHHTYFFRESRSFEILRHDCRRIWCAASSSGEEAYSVAAYCFDLGFQPEILATDISENCLQKARTALYPSQNVRHIPERILKSCFQKGINRWHGYIRVKPKIRQMVHFQRFNLIKDIAPDDRFDVIFCRNVMIYFDCQTKEKVLETLCSRLQPNGYFVIGGAESLSGLNHRLTYIKPSVYRKK